MGLRDGGEDAWLVCCGHCAGSAAVAFTMSVRRQPAFCCPGLCSSPLPAARRNALDAPPQGKVASPPPPLCHAPLSLCCTDTPVVKFFDTFPKPQRKQVCLGGPNGTSRIHIPNVGWSHKFNGGWEGKSVGVRPGGAVRGEGELDACAVPLAFRRQTQDSRALRRTSPKPCFSLGQCRAERAPQAGAALFAALVCGRPTFGEPSPHDRLARHPLPLAQAVLCSQPVLQAGRPAFATLNLSLPRLRLPSAARDRPDAARQGVVMPLWHISARAMALFHEACPHFVRGGEETDLGYCTAAVVCEGRAEVWAVLVPPPPLQTPPPCTPPPPLGDRHFHVFLVNMYCAGLCCPSALRMALHCFPITSNQAPVCFL